MEEGLMPKLNYAEPLHTFTNSQSTFTATKTCYLVGVPYQINSYATTINGTIIGTNDAQWVFYRLEAGDVVSGFSKGLLHVFDVAS